MIKLDSKIRKVPNWPKKGILFYDITPLFEDPSVFHYIVEKLIDPFRNEKIDKIVAIDARGFLIAAPIALKLNVGLSLVRKKGKLPYKTIETMYEKEYGPDILAIHKDTIKKGEKILIVDDLLATGGTVQATLELVKKLHGEIVGLAFIINLAFLPGLRKLQDQGLKVHYLIEYNSEMI